MKVNIVSKQERYIEIEFGGEGHTLLNFLQNVLTEDPDVEMAGYTKPHPLMDRSRLEIKTKKGKDPQETLKKATIKANEKLKEFLKEFESSLSLVSK